MNNKRYRPLLHRFIFEHFHNYELKENEQIDHINGNKLDNKISNLRKVNNAQNCQNKSNKRKDSKQKFKGIQETPYGYKANIQYNGNKEYLGTFKNAKTAYKKYMKRAKELNRLENCTFHTENN